MCGEELEAVLELSLAGKRPGFYPQDHKSVLGPPRPTAITTEKQDIILSFLTQQGQEIDGEKDLNISLQTTRLPAWHFSGADSRGWELSPCLTHFSDYYLPFL